jgi:hypothetical protein
MVRVNGAVKFPANPDVLVVPLKGKPAKLTLLTVVLGTLGPPTLNAPTRCRAYVGVTSVPTPK